MDAEEPSQEMDISHETGIDKLLRIYLHGLLWSVIFGIIIVGWAFLFVTLALVALFLGLIIAIVVLVYLMGLLNRGLSEWIWGLELMGDWLSNFIHGVFLAIMLAIIHIPIGLTLVLLFPSLPDVIAMLLPTLLIYPFIDGYFAWVIGTSFVNE